jgi:hypothetical protein
MKKAKFNEKFPIMMLVTKRFLSSNDPRKTSETRMKRALMKFPALFQLPFNASLLTGGKNQEVIGSMGGVKPRMTCCV